MAKLALVDDHILLRNGLASLIVELGHEVLFEADHGKQCIDKIQSGLVPDVILLDINMPVMDGFEAAIIIKEKHPSVRILALSMYDHEQSIIRMLKNGAVGYILKDCHPSELQQAIESVHTKGFYYSDLVSGKLVYALTHLDEQGNNTQVPVLNEKEIQFLKYACTELTYKEIADKMFVSPRTIDGYRDVLCEKLNTRTRVGLVMYAMRNGIAE